MSWDDELGWCVGATAPAAALPLLPCEQAGVASTWCAVDLTRLQAPVVHAEDRALGAARSPRARSLARGATARNPSHLWV